MPVASKLSNTERQHLDAARPYTEATRDDASSSSEAPTLLGDGYPLIHHPNLGRDSRPAEFNRTFMSERQTRVRLVDDFFRAIHEGNRERLASMVNGGLVSPSVLNERGRSALNVAVADKKTDAVRCLVELGADLNQLAPTDRYPYPERTPLQIAAEDGSLVIVKILMEAGADDGLVAPDGQIALRLAAKNGHREILQYLPARRGGGWRRWKKEHDKAIRGIGRALENLFELFEAVFIRVPLFFIWYLPKTLIFKPLKRGIKFAVENRHAFAGWCKRQVVKMPRRTKKLVKGIGKAVVKTPGAIARLVKWLFRLLLATPGVVLGVAMLIGRWLWESTKSLGRALGAIIDGFFSVLHTILCLMVEYFGRITFRDVWNGFCSLMEAVFVSLPVAVWRVIWGLPRTVIEFLVGFIGGLGIVVWYFLKAAWWIISYGPRQLFYMLCDIVKSVGKGFQEVMVMINPKCGV